MTHAIDPNMLLKIDLSKEDKKLFDQVQVDIQGVKVDDPTAFIAVRYANKTTGAHSNDTLLPVTDIDKYANEEFAEPTEEIKKDEPKVETNSGDKGNAGKSPRKPTDSQSK